MPKISADDYARMNGAQRCELVGRVMRKRWLQMGRPEQRPFKVGGPRVSLFSGGRGTGKSRSGAEWAAEQALLHPNWIGALLAPDYRGATQNALFNETSGLCKIIPDQNLFQWREKRNELTFANGSRILTFSSEHPKNMRGPNFNFAWVDEMADLEHGMECWKILNPAVRILGKNGEPARVYLTGTPKATELMLHLMQRQQMSPDRYELQTGRMMDNAANLDPEFIEDMYSENEGSRYFKQEIEGILLLEAERALWTLDTIEKCQRRHDPDKLFLSLAIAVDPAVSSKKKADETGIIAGGLCDDRRAYILADFSTKGSPLNWGRVLAQHAADLGVATIYYEHNLAGPLIRDVLLKCLEEIDPGIRLIPVTARGKKEARADKVSALYEAGKVLHMPLIPGGLDKLEQEQTQWDPTDKSFSPGRIDACVHLVDRLLSGGRGSTIMRPSAMPWGKSGFKTGR